MIDPEVGFTSDVIRDPNRFVGRIDLIRDCMRALNSRLGLLAVYGKRGVGKSSLLRQIQQMALGDYTLARKAGLGSLIPNRPRTYVTCYYTCDAMVRGGVDLVTRLCNDQDEEDGLLRLVPDDGKELVEFTRTKEVSAGADLKIVNWGAKGIENSKYARVVKDDPVQTFRNAVSAVVAEQVKKRMKRDALLILLDEFDVVQDKNGIGSLIKSLTSEAVKFGICGISEDLSDLVQDHASVERLLEEGGINVKPMPPAESMEIIRTAERLFRGAIRFDSEVIARIAQLAEGYPYLVQLFGKACVDMSNRTTATEVTPSVLDSVLSEVQSGSAFPTLENAYQRAIGDSPGRQMLLHLLAEQPEDRTSFNDDIGQVVLKKIRALAQDLEVDHVDQLIPRLVDKAYGPALVRSHDRPGIYSFYNPLLRIYVKLRSM